MLRQRLLGDQVGTVVIHALHPSLFHPAVDGGGAVAAQRFGLPGGQHIRFVLPAGQKQFPQIVAVQILPRLPDRRTAAGEDPRRQYPVQLPGIPPLQKADHVLQPDLKAAGLLAGVLAGDHAMLQQPHRLALADVADAVELIHATLYHFGVITSNVHMAWMRTVAGRLKSDYRYSKELVYNTFPWPEATEKQIAVIEEAAQGVLDERSKHPGTSLADLYDPTLMKTTGMQKAHTKLDRAVWAAYGANWKSEAECVADLMERYQKLVEEKGGIVDAKK